MMRDPPGTVPLPNKQNHPRRPPAHQSVSLRHSPPAAGRPPKAPTFYHPPSTSQESPHASDKANPPSSVSPKVQSNKHSSGESSDAGKWFESSNNNALQSNASFTDNDPPFFLRNSSSADTPPDGRDGHVPHGNPYHARTAIPYRPGLAQNGTDGSSSEDYRGVIDDLTVANKKLRQKLRKYEKLHDSHLQHEKLFEVSFHGLSDHKKKELEDTLRKFAASLGDSPNSDHALNAANLHRPPPFDAQKTASSHASRFAESGYASMSASGQNSISAPSNQTSNQTFNQASNQTSNQASWGGRDRQGMTKSQYSRQQQSIQSFLHDIPAGLMPKSHAPMTEKSRKKLVVRRLEQIFAGKRSVPGNHTQPMQQEEVAQSAAMADRQAKEATGQRSRTEGHREARIMPARAEEEENNAAQVNPDSLQKLRPSLHINEQDFAGSSSPDQRPTRPLDLDPFRAQVPAENMEYIRHLGFTPPNMVTGEAPELGHGWIYLNLLINMAQLHTFNVTPDFVKDAVTEYSSKFELSPDGRKIRWRGGLDESKVSSGSSSEHFSGDSPYDSTLSNGKSPSKDLRTGHSGNDESSLDPERKERRLARAQKHMEHEKFNYNPIFFHKEESDEDENVYGYEVGSSSASPFHPQRPGNSSGLASSAVRSFSSKKRRDNGPMIFYNKAKFCTDLSGDLRGLKGYNYSSYNSITDCPLGAPNAAAAAAATSHPPANAEVRRCDTLPADMDTKDGGSRSSSDADIEFSPEALRNDNGTDSSDTIDFEASGLGGVQPDDNFSIRVRRSQIQTAPRASLAGRRKSHNYSQRILEALGENGNHANAEGSSLRHPGPSIKEEILSTSHKSLPSSTLPPASFLPFDSTSSGDVDSDLDSDVSSNQSSTGSSENPNLAQRVPNMSPIRMRDGYESHGVEYSDDGDDDDDDDDDESIDLLATARRMDPQTIRDSEREYDAAIAERLAEIIPAGSSAATAGGGSGFHSPEQMGDAENPNNPPRTPRRSTTSGSLSSRARNLKRTRALEMSGSDVQGSKGRKSQKTE